MKVIKFLILSIILCSPFTTFSIDPIKEKVANSSQYHKSKVNIKTKSGERFSGFLVDANDEEIYLVKKRSEVPKALDNNCSNCKVYKYENLNKIKFKKSPIVAIIGLFFAVVAVLFFAWAAAIFNEGFQATQLILLAIVIAAPFLLVNKAINKNKTINKNITSEKKLLISYVKSKSAKRIVLDDIFNSNISEIDLLRTGYINHKKSYLIFPIEGRYKKGYLVSADEDTLYYVKLKKYLKPALSGEKANLKTIKIADISNIR